MSDLTPARADLASAITEIIVDLPPGGFDGDTIVDRLYANGNGRTALIAVGRELASEQIREAGRQLGEALTQMVEAFGIKKPGPTVDTNHEH